MRIGVVTARSPAGEVGGAERFFEALIGAFRAEGHEAEEVAVTTDESSIDAIKENYLRCYDLDLSRFDAVVSTKAPTWMVRHPRHVCYLVHTIRVFYDMYDATFPHADGELHAQRSLIHQLDSAGLRTPHCRKIFAIGKEVADRLREWNGIGAEVLHPPLWGDGFNSLDAEDFVLLPGRLHPWKRVDLAVQSMRHVKSSTRLLVCGTGESADSLRALASGIPNIEFLGRVPDHELRELYARARAVLFPPRGEDYGYVTLEAFASSRPVVTCSDSGEAATIVAQSQGGLIVNPRPEDIGAALDQLAADPQGAVRMGARGNRWLQGLSWRKVVTQLTEALTP